MDDLLAKALASLPHGAEFRFIDRLVSLEPGVSGVGTYQLRGDEPFLKGHFPGRPLLPGVLLVEAGAQLAGIVAQCAPSIPPLTDLRLTALRSVKILGSAEPGQVIQIEARVTGRLGNLVQAEAKVLLGSQTIMQGALTLSGTLRVVQSTAAVNS